MEGIAREAPVPIVRVRGANSDTYSPGGGANVCANVADAGPKTYPISVFGDDLHGFELTKQLKARNMDTRFIVLDESRVTPTFEKFYASAHGSPVQQVGRVDMENVARISKASEDRIVESIRDAKDFVDAMVVADYADTPGTWVVTEEVMAEIVATGAETDLPIVTDSRTRMTVRGHNGREAA
jgi:bifunctional ADP-heptose synthase (sugar kinase/adenylyltransferase)